MLSYRYGPTDQGANTNETILTLDKVHPWNFGLKATVPVPVQIYASPLIRTVSAQTTHAYVCSLSNVVKAVDTANPTNTRSGWTLVLTNNGQPVHWITSGGDIWNSNASPADALGQALKFTVPIVANGQVFVGTDGTLQIYGLVAAARH